MNGRNLKRKKRITASRSDKVNCNVHIGTNNGSRHEDP